jgi:hypothetical protein
LLDKKFQSVNYIKDNFYFTKNVCGFAILCHYEHDFCEKEENIKNICDFFFQIKLDF